MGYTGGSDAAVLFHFNGLYAAMRAFNKPVHRNPVENDNLQMSPLPLRMIEHLHNNTARGRLSSAKWTIPWLLSCLLRRRVL